MLPRAPRDVDLRDGAPASSAASASASASSGGQVDLAVRGDGVVVEAAAGADTTHPDAQLPEVAEQSEHPGRPGDLAVVRDASTLSDQELAVLAVERRRYRHQGAKEQAVRDELGLSATRYYQLLNALLDDEAALAHDPVLVARLRRLRHARTAGPPA